MLIEEKGVHWLKQVRTWNISSRLEIKIVLFCANALYIFQSTFSIHNDKSRLILGNCENKIIRISLNSCTHLSSSRLQIYFKYNNCIQDNKRLLKERKADVMVTQKRLNIKNYSGGFLEFVLYFVHVTVVEKLRPGATKSARCPTNYKKILD